jgi:hypothetical protein
VEAHADWLEFCCLQGEAKRVSWSDHQRDLRLGSEGEGVEGAEFDDRTEALLTDVVEELEARTKACGTEGTYPFRVDPNGLDRLGPGVGSVYEFLLLLSFLGPGASGARIFEDLSLAAALRYLCADAVVPSGLAFGFPRRIGPAGFRAAVEDLCRKLGEGGGCQDEPEVGRQKDAHLDLVVWSRFPDGHSSQLIAMGQCAAGEDWFEKIHELRPGEWCRLWLKHPPLIDPVGCYFVPHRLERQQWRRASQAGIVFDRCRISWLVPVVPQDLVERIDGWHREAAAWWAPR